MPGTMVLGFEPLATLEIVLTAKHKRLKSLYVVGELKNRKQPGALVFWSVLKGS